MSSFSERYTLRVPLGESSLGSVWTALDRETSQQVVVLRLEEEAATETAKARFRDHAERLRKIDHPNVVKALDHGDDEEGIPYLVVELLEGESLAVRWASAPLRTDKLVEIAIAVAEGLGALHAAGFSHGDLEPGNVFLAGAKGSETPKLIGIALNRVYARVGDEGEERTSVATLHQLYAYAAPEQVSGTIVDSPAADLYSLAAIVFAGLTGRPPHVAPTVIALLESVTRKKAPTLVQVKKDLSPFSATIDRALSTEPAKRYPDAASFARALKTCLVMGRSLAAQELPVGPRSPIGQPLQIPAAGAAAGAAKTARTLPKPGAASPTIKGVAAPRAGASAAAPAGARTGADAKPEANGEPEKAADTPANAEPEANAKPGAGAENEAPPKAEAATPETAGKAAGAAKMPVVARPLPRPAAPTTRGLSPIAKPAKAAEPPRAVAGVIPEPEGPVTEELEISVGSVAPPPPVPAGASEGIEERQSLELEELPSSELSIPPEIAARPPPPPPRPAAAPRPPPPRAAEAHDSEAEAPAAGEKAAGLEYRAAGPEDRAAGPEDRAGPIATSEAEDAAKASAAASAGDAAKPGTASGTAAAEPATAAFAADATTAGAASEIGAAEPGAASGTAAKPSATVELPIAKPAAAASAAEARGADPPNEAEPVPALTAPSLGSDDDVAPPARPGWIMPAAIAAVVLLVVIGGAMTLGGGEETDVAEPPIVGAPSATAAEADTVDSAETASGAEAAATETAPEIPAVTAPEAPAELAPTRPAGAEPETIEAEVVPAPEPSVAPATAARAPATAEPATARTGSTATPRTGTTASRTTTVTPPRTTTGPRTTTAPRTTVTPRTGTARTATGRGGSRGRPTVVSDPGF